MKKIILLLVCFASIAGKADAQTTLTQGISDLAIKVVEDVSREQKNRIAVLPLRQLSGDHTLFGEYISEELLTHLYEADNIEIVERSLLDQLLGEIQLGRTGVIDPETAKKVGKVAGVDAIVTGTITELQTYVALNCRLIDTETGRVFGAAQAKVFKDADVSRMLSFEAASPETSDQPSPEKNSGTSASEAANHVEAEERGFRFEGQGCSRRGGVVQCVFLITSLDSDRELTVFNSYTNNGARFSRSRPNTGPTRLVDDTGSESFSSEESTLGTMGGERPHARLVSDIPVKLTLVFPTISSAAKYARLLEIVCLRGPSVSVGGFGDHSGSVSEVFVVQMRNLPITQR